MVFKGKKAFMDDFLDVAWTCFFVFAIAFLVGVYSETKSNAIHDQITGATSEIDRDSSLLAYLRTPITADGKTQPVIDWLDDVLLKNSSDPIGECTRVLGPETVKIFLQTAGEKGFVFEADLDKNTICTLRGGSISGSKGVSAIELPSIFPGKTLSVRLTTAKE